MRDGNSNINQEKNIMKLKWTKIVDMKNRITGTNIHWCYLLIIRDK